MPVCFFTQRNHLASTAQRSSNNLNKISQTSIISDPQLEKDKDMSNPYRPNQKYFKCQRAAPDPFGYSGRKLYFCKPCRDTKPREAHHCKEHEATRKHRDNVKVYDTPLSPPSPSSPPAARRDAHTSRGLAPANSHSVNAAYDVMRWPEELRGLIAICNAMAAEHALKSRSDDYHAESNSTATYTDHDAEESARAPTQSPEDKSTTQSPPSSPNTSLSWAEFWDSYEAEELARGLSREELLRRDIEQAILDLRNGNI